MNSETKQLDIAVVGAGISGLSAAWLLSKQHRVTVFEAEENFGGHANTVAVKTLEGNINVDTGFIVCNDRNYPNFLELLKEIGITPYPTEMSFGVSMDSKSFEYAGSNNLINLFAQPRNIIRPRFWKMITSLRRFYRETSRLNPNEQDNVSLRDYLTQNNYSDNFIQDHILPMAAAVWSTPSNKVGDFPLTSFLRFCQNHGLLQVNDRPQWYSIPGGSRRYVKALMDKTNAHFLANTPITSIRRTQSGVEIISKSGEVSEFDKILIATHANTALKMLTDADTLEQDILSAFSYSKNTAVLHSDSSLMPKRKLAWSSWNYLQNNSRADKHLSVTYWMNKLQPLPTKMPIFVTLNPTTEIADSHVHYTKEYEHPIFDLATLAAQKRLGELMGYRNVWYAGAHFGYGFHEDGVQSGLYAGETLGGQIRPWITPDMNSRLIMLSSKYEPEGQAS